ncbi:MAG: methionine--tRNA ligase [Planctomycetota bacterium]
MSPRQILVTSALPYANGPIHLGHLVEYIQTDIWVRFQKLAGHRCIYLCADDTHGTAIMIRARQEGRTEEELIAEMSERHQRDFARFEIGFDHYGSTHSADNRSLCGEFWTGLRSAGLIVEREVTQLYDPVAGTFLADRFVRGTCPRCQSPNQYGDNCDRCQATYSPSDLVDPVSTLSGARPEIRSARHLFVELEKMHDFLQEWTQSGDHLQSEVANYLQGNFLNEPLRDWDVSRPAPYFGFEIPDSPGDYWYVWFDAPIGYLAATAEWCRAHGENLADWWKSPAVEIHHFIGKDITYFHTLFWPGMLRAAGYQLPTKVHIHGFLTIGGEKMSKSKGTFIRAENYLKWLDPSYLRYYYASKLGPRLDDMDLNLDEFVAKVNADLVNKVVNLASRSAKLVQSLGLSATYPEDGGLFQQGATNGAEIAAAYEACDFSKATRLIMELADRANAYIDAQAPWKLKNDPELVGRLQDICTVSLNLFRQIVVYLAPILPRLARQTAELLGSEIEVWSESARPLVGTPVAPFQHFMKRIERKDVDAMIEDSKEVAPGTTTAGEPSGAPAAAAASPVVDSDQPLLAEPLAPQISIDEFSKIDLRVARVVSAEDVPEATKLLKLTVSLGGEHRRTIFAGIKAAYRPEQLVGRLVIIVANLAPRQMKFGLSEGMVVELGPGEKEVFLLALDEGAKPGQRAH